MVHRCSCACLHMLGVRASSASRTWRSSLLVYKSMASTAPSAPSATEASSGPSVDQFPAPPPGHRLLVEGQAAIPFSEGNEVFYNKVQEFNRDLSIHVIKLFAEKRLREKTEHALRKTRRVRLGTAALCFSIFRSLPLSHFSLVL